jgi:RNA recognition motif-containing protein
MDKPKKSRDNLKEFDKNKIIVRNLPFTTSYADISKKFSECGKIDEIILPKKSLTENKGYAFVKFSTTDEMKMVFLFFPFFLLFVCCFFFYSIYRL